jgi:hypothetical protein
MTAETGAKDRQIDGQTNQTGGIFCRTFKKEDQQRATELFKQTWQAKGHYVNFNSNDVLNPFCLILIAIISFHLQDPVVAAGASYFGITSTIAVILLKTAIPVLVVVPVALASRLYLQLTIDTYIQTSLNQVTVHADGESEIAFFLQSLSDFLRVHQTHPVKFKRVLKISTRIATRRRQGPQENAG